MGKISKVYIPSNEEFCQIIANAFCYNDCIKALGLSTSGGGHTTDILKRRIKELNCDISHFKTTTTERTHNNKRYSLEEILIPNSPYTSTSKLKERLIKENILEYKCAICGNIGEWNGQSLSLQLDHIDGDNRNNTLENLRLLCPNCHSQTDTFAGKNVKNEDNELNYCIECGALISKKATKCHSCENKSRIILVENLPITREELKELIRKETFTSIIKQYNISDKTLRKWCSKFNLPQSKREIISYSNEEWELL